MKELSYRHTLTACYLGYVSQAIVNNLGPLLFLTFQRQFDISIGRLALLTSLNFGTQLLLDLAAARFVDRIGYRTAAVSAGVFCGVGLFAMGILPFVLPVPYWGLLIAVIINALGGGLLEVIISPIVEALPTSNKSAAMSLLHSFYCWGFVAVVLLSSAYFGFVGIEHWRYLPMLWALLPLGNALLFTRVPIWRLVEDSAAVVPLRALFTKKIFLIFLLLMVCAGATEQALCQWASFFAEAGLKVSKTMGDLLGPCAFAALMGLSRVYFGSRKEEMEIKRILLIAAAFCAISYLITVFSPFPLLSLGGCALCGLSVGVLWPGIFSMTSRVFPQGGTAMFAILALAGDAGCALGPGVVGLVMGETTLNSGLLVATLFPLLLAVGVSRIRQNSGDPNR
ncbi:MAG: MFS transporter [Treponema sp.]|jgi:MFS family permease|nr:MFS transporter [Treponema sp.]